MDEHLGYYFTAKPLGDSSIKFTFEVFLGVVERYTKVNQLGPTALVNGASFHHLASHQNKYDSHLPLLISGHRDYVKGYIEALEQDLEVRIMEEYGT